jgi:hypothetical protein
MYPVSGNPVNVRSGRLWGIVDLAGDKVPGRFAGFLVLKSSQYPASANPDGRTEDPRSVERFFGFSWAARFAGGLKIRAPIGPTL